MASLVLGVVGAAVGGAVGGPTGAQFGWMIGSAIGGVIDQPKIPAQIGPTLNDRKIQSSAYGTSIPALYGFPPVAGNIIWSTEKIPTQHVTGGGGGKGGGGQPQQVSTTYSVSFALALCEGVAVSITKIRANGKLIYNNSSTASVSTLVASTAAGAFGGGTSNSAVRFYTGSETQLPDALIQSYLGINNTPAYRGTCYLVFENFQLAAYGNQMPNIEVEVVMAGSFASSLTLQNTQVNLPAYPYNTSRLTSNTSIFAMAGYQSGVCIYSIQNPGVPQLTAKLSVGATRSIGCYGTNAVVSGSSTQIYDGLTGAVISTLPVRSDTVVMDANNVYCIDLYSGILTILGIASRAVSSAIYIGGSPLAATLQGAYLYVSCQGSNYVVAINVTNPSSPYIAWTIPGYGQVEILGSSLLLVGINLDIYALNGDIAPVHQSGLAGVSAAPSYMIGLSGNNLITYGGGNGGISAYDVSNPSAPAYLCGWAIPIYDSASAISAFGGYVYYGLYENPQSVAPLVTLFLSAKIPSPTAPTIGSIIADRHARAGYLPSEYDVSTLTDTLDGYICQRGPARGSIEPLLQAFFIDCIESDGVLKYVKRGMQPVATIAEDDLAAHIGGGQLPDQFTLTRAQELDLPMEITVGYLDTNADGLVGTQYSRRLTAPTRNITGVQLAMRMSATKAKQVADALLYNAWTERTTFTKIPLSLKYAKLEPTDVINVVKGAHTYTVRLTKKDEQQGICTFDAVLNDVNMWSVTAQGGLSSSVPAISYPTPSQVVTQIGKTDLLLLDIPLLRDQDDGVGFYSAACGYLPGWSGAQPFKSNDGGLTWGSYGNALLHGASIGSASTVLGNFLSGDIFDETNSVTVSMLNGTLSSLTELGVLNGGNAALIGSEIIQFKTATLTAQGVYTLTGLLRGVRGTEWAMSSHVTGERFVMLDPVTLGLDPAASAEYGLARQYRGVTMGGFLNDAAVINFTNTAVAQKPYSPVQLGGGRDTAGNLTINWTRRTRINGSWNNFADVPLGEASESYSIDIMSGTTVKRTLNSITPTVQYTSAQQVTDFGSNQAAILVNVYQISATIGRGYPATATV